MLDNHFKIVATNITTAAATVGTLFTGFLESNWPAIGMLLIGASSAYLNHKAYKSREEREKRKDAREEKEHQIRIDKLIKAKRIP